MRGFSLVELMIVLVVVGMLLGFGIPSYHRYLQSQALVGGSQNLVQTVQLQRSRAMATGQTVTLNFDTTAAGWITLQGSKANRYQLPRGVRYASATPMSLQFTRDGHVDNSAIVVLQNSSGARDTVSIMVSGLALVR
jgi:prepilin-type N-terminal cleavage/methylation domain-containing protein